MNFIYKTLIVMFVLFTSLTYSNAVVLKPDRINSTDYHYSADKPVNSGSYAIASFEDTIDVYL